MEFRVRLLRCAYGKQNKRINRAAKSLNLQPTYPGGEIGRHARLRALCLIRACWFESSSGYKTKLKLPTAVGSFFYAAKFKNWTSSMSRECNDSGKSIPRTEWFGWWHPEKRLIRERPVLGTKQFRARVKSIQRFTLVETCFPLNTQTQHIYFYSYARSWYSVLLDQHWRMPMLQ